MHYPHDPHKEHHDIDNGTPSSRRWHPPSDAEFTNRYDRYHSSPLVRSSVHISRYARIHLCDRYDVGGSMRGADSVVSVDSKHV
jgi:hypothetical protein